MQRAQVTARPRRTLFEAFLAAVELHGRHTRIIEDARKAHAGRFRKFFAAMLAEGIYLAPSPFEAGFVSTAHRPRDLARTLAAAAGALRRASRVR